jgi:hypothetical protein
MPVVALAMPTILGLPVLSAHNVGQVVNALDGADHNIAAVPTISAVRTSAGYVFFSAETQTAIAALSRFDFDFNAVDKHASRYTNRRVSLVAQYNPAIIAE